MPTATRLESKVETVIEHLREMALRLGAGAKLPTVRSLRRQLRVSQTTLSEALRQLEAGDILDRRHGSGLYVSRHVNRTTIGAVLGFDCFHPHASAFYRLLLDSAVQRARQGDESFSFFIDVPGAPGGEAPVHRDLAEAVQSGRLDGILLLARRSRAQEDWLRRTGVAVVTLAGQEERPWIVNHDAEDLVRRAVGALVEQGCRRLGLATRAEAGSYARETLAGRTFRQCLTDRGLPVRTDWVYAACDPTPSAPFSGEALGRAAMHHLFAANRLAEGADALPDGLVFTDDIWTAGAMAVADQRGLDIGGAVKIATHANKGSPLLEPYAARLTLFEFDPAEAVEALFTLLERQMTGKNVGADRILLKAHLRTPEPGGGQK